MTQLIANLVGMHFRPPAKDVVANLPQNAGVELRRQPENEYDPFAVMVLLHGFGYAEGMAWASLFQTLSDHSTTPEVLVEAGWVDPLPLGYIDSKKTGMAKMFSDIMDEAGMTSCEGWLTFDPAGKPQITTEFEPFQTDEGEDVMGEQDESDEMDAEAHERHIRSSQLGKT